MDIKQKSFNDFTVYYSNEMNSFVHINIGDGDSFYQSLFEYFFKEERILQYIENKASISFQPSRSNYATLYKKLKIFIDKENLINYPEKLDEDILNIVLDEHTVVEQNGHKKIRLDKIGKIGEYIFSNILSEYFGLQCIIPKLNLLTDYNMSIFGIDTLFYSPEEKMIFLGESKVSKNLKNGISLINKSLSTYQSQVDDEFQLILSQRWLKDKMGFFSEDFGDIIETSISMENFIKEADIQKIGIPIFIAHGEIQDVSIIFDKMKKINRINLYGIDTQYITISLPLIDKDRFAETFTNAIAERMRMYESNVQ